LVEAIKWTIDQRLKLVNLSTGTDVSKLRWSPIARRYCARTEVQPGRRAHHWSDRNRRIPCISHYEQAQLVAHGEAFGAVMFPPQYVPARRCERRGRRYVAVQLVPFRNQRVVEI
jgi:hypothetical protein